MTIRTCHPLTLLLVFFISVDLFSKPVFKAQPRPNESFDSVDIEDIKNGDLNPGLITLAPRLSYFQLSTTDRASGAKGNIVSSLSPGVRAFWTHHFDGTVNPVFYGNFTLATLEPPTGVSLRDSKQAIWGFGVGLEFPLSPTVPLFLSFLVGLEKDFLTRRVSASELVLESIYLPRASLGVGYTFALDKTGHWGLGLQAMGSAYFSTSPNGYTVRNGWDTSLRAFLANRLSKAWEVRLGPFFAIQKLNSSVTDQTRTDLGGELVVVWQYAEM